MQDTRPLFHVTERTAEDVYGLQYARAGTAMRSDDRGRKHEEPALSRPLPLRPGAGNHARSV